MNCYKEAKRLVERYDYVFASGMQRELDRPVHIGVLETAIIILEEEIGSLSEEIQHWSDTIEYAYTARLTIPKWKIVHRFIMFVLARYVEHEYDRACDKIEIVSEYKEELAEFLQKFMNMEALWI